MMKKYILKLAMWLAKQCGEDLVRMTYVDPNVLSAAQGLCNHVAKQETSGEHKRGQVLRALMNVFPDKKERELAAAIERCMCSE